MDSRTDQSVIEFIPRKSYRVEFGGIVLVNCFLKANCWATLFLANLMIDLVIIGCASQGGCVPRFGW